MKLLTATQIRELDQFTIENEPIASIDLMERAARKCSNWIWKKYYNSKFAIFCGTGNNGGDGLAIARHIIEKNIDVEVYILGNPELASEDFKTNYEKLKAKSSAGIYLLNEQAHIFSLSVGTVAVDAIFGTGLDRVIGGWRADVINELNNSINTIISIDIPSGLMSEQFDLTDSIIISADSTLSFQIPKRAFMFAENCEYFGSVEVLDIGLGKSKHNDFESDLHYLDQEFINSLIKPRKRFSHKGTFGHLLLVAGSKGKVGAAVLASRAAIRSGLGLLTVHVPECAYTIMQTSVPEAMCVTDRNNEIITSVDITEKYSALAIGPGLGIEEESAQMLEDLLHHTNLIKVIDADALNILAIRPSLLTKLGSNTILTPHPKEFDRLFGEHNTSFDRFITLKKKAKELDVIVILKGAHTRIALPDGQVYFNSTGNSGMATGGSGDVLTGIIGSLLAQGYTASDAAILGVYTHGLAGDWAAESNGIFGLIASDIVEGLSKVY